MAQEASRVELQGALPWSRSFWESEVFGAGRKAGTMASSFDDKVTSQNVVTEVLQTLRDGPYISARDQCRDEISKLAWARRLQATQSAGHAIELLNNAKNRKMFFAYAASAMTRPAKSAMTHPKYYRWNSVRKAIMNGVDLSEFTGTFPTLFPVLSKERNVEPEELPRDVVWFEHQKMLHGYLEVEEPEDGYDSDQSEPSRKAQRKKLLQTLTLTVFGENGVRISDPFVADLTPAEITKSVTRGNRWLYNAAAM